MLVTVECRFVELKNRLFVGTTKKYLWNFRFRCRPKSEEISRWSSCCVM